MGLTDNIICSWKKHLDSDHLFLVLNKKSNSFGHDNCDLKIWNDSPNPTYTWKATLINWSMQKWQNMNKTSLYGNKSLMF